MQEVPFEVLRGLHERWGRKRGLVEEADRTWECLLGHERVEPLGRTTGLLVSERFDRVHVRGAPSRVEAEDHPDEDRDAEGEHRGDGGHDRL